MLKQFAAVLLLVMCSQAGADTTLYQDLSKAMKGTLPGYEEVKTPSGLDYNSKETFKNSKGKSEPLAHMYVEGPLSDERVNTLEKAINFTARLIYREVDGEYKTDNMIYPGLGVNVVDVNGTKVAMFDYKISHEPDSYGYRAAIVTDKGLYSYSLSMHKSKPKDKTGLHLMALVIASVNTGKL